MSNSLFVSARAGFLGGDIAWDTDTIRFCLIDQDSYAALTDITFFTQIPTAARVKIYEEAGGIGGKTISSGIADCNDATLSAVSGGAGAAFGAIVIFADSGSYSTSRLIAWIDTATGLPASPNSGDIVLSFSNGASKVFIL